MTAFLVAAALAPLALLDGTFACFRASAGRTGLIDHRRADLLACLRGGMLACVLLAPVVAIASTEVTLHPPRLAIFARAGEAMLAVYGPYGLVVLAVLAVEPLASQLWYARLPRARWPAGAAPAPADRPGSSR